MGCGASKGTGTLAEPRQATSEPLQAPCPNGSVVVKGKDGTGSGAHGVGSASSFTSSGGSSPYGQRAKQLDGKGHTEQVTRDEAPLAAVRMGVSLRGIRRLRQRIRSSFGESRYASATTAEVTEEWVKPVTLRHKCRVAEVRSLVDASDVGVPSYFISHAWKNSFEGLVQAVEEHLAAAAEETVVWIDIFAVNQHSDTHYQSLDVGAFKDVIRAATGGTIVIMGDFGAAVAAAGGGNPATRAWCIYEWAATLAVHGPDGLHMSIGPAARGEVVRCLDVEKADCFKPEDKAFILADVVAQHGSTAAFNAKLRLQLLLEPLSYAVDLRRLLVLPAGTGGEDPAKARTTAGSGVRGQGQGQGQEQGQASTTSGAVGQGQGPSTAWDWAPVEAWLAAGRPQAAAAAAVVAGGPNTVPNGVSAGVAGPGTAGGGGGDGVSRVLCLVGGLGQGKSMACAAMLGPDGPLGGGGADGYVASCCGGAAHGGRAVHGGGGGGVVVAYHFLNSSDRRRQEPVRIVKSLAFQLAVKLPAFREAILQLDAASVVRLGEGEADVEAAFVALLLQPLRAHEATFEQQRHTHPPPMVVLLIDGLDDADPPEEQQQQQQLQQGQQQQLQQGPQELPTSQRSHQTQQPSSAGAVAGVPAAAAAPASGTATATTESPGTTAGAVVVPGSAVPAPQRAPLVPRIRGNLALTLITGQLLRLPPALTRFIVTTRTEAASGQVLPSLYRTFGGAGSGGGGAPLAPVVQLAPGQLRRRPGGEAVADGAASNELPLCRAVAQVCAEMGLAVRRQQQGSRGERGGGSGGVRGAASAAGCERLVLSELFSSRADTDVYAGGADLAELYDMYDKIFSAAFASAALSAAAVARDVVALMSVLLAAQEPLSQAFLQQLGLAHAVELLPGWGRLFFPYEHRIHMGHKALAEFLQWRRQQPLQSSTKASGSAGGRDRGRGGGGGGGGAASGTSWASVDPSLGHWIIGRHLVLHELAAPSSYCMRYVVHHLAAAAAAAAAPGGDALATAAWAEPATSSTSRAHTVAATGKMYGSGNDTAGVSSKTPLELLDVVLSDFGFLARVCGSGNGPKVIGGLSAVPSHVLSQLGYDALRWLRASLYDGAGGAAAAGAPSSRVRGESLGTSTALARTVVFAAPVTSPLQSLAAGLRNQRWRTTRVLPWRPPYRTWSALNLTLRGHTNEVGAVAWSPDGRQLLSGGADGIILVWDAATGACTAALAGHTNAVRCLRWGPGGRQLASAARDQATRVWDAATGQCTVVLLAGDVYDMSWSPDERLLATTGTAANGVFLWDAATAVCLGLIQGHASWVWSVAWRPDGGALASGGADGTVRQWDAATGQQLTAPMQGHFGDVNGVAWSPDGRRLASCGSDGTVRQWDAATGAPFGTELRGHTDQVLSISWATPCEEAIAAVAAITAAAAGPAATVAAAGSSGRGSSSNSNGSSGWLASAGCDRTVRLWDADRGCCVAVLDADGTGGRVGSVAWRPDGVQVAASCPDGAVRVWDVASAAAASAAGRCKGPQQRLPSNKSVPGDRPGMSVTPTPTPTPAPTPSPAPQPTSGPRIAVSWSPDGALLAGGCGDSTVGVWDAQLGECVAVLYGHYGDVSSVTWSPDGRRLASSGGDESIRVWDLATHACLLTLTLVRHQARPIPPQPQPPRPQQTPQTQPQEQELPLEFLDQALALPPAVEQQQSWGWVFSVAWSPAGGKLASGTADGVVRLHDVTTGECTSALRGHLGAVLRVAWAPDGRQVASCGSDDGAVRLWDVASGSCVRVLRVAAPGWGAGGAAYAGQVSYMAWSPNGHRVASNDASGLVRVWDAATGQCTAALSGHTGPVYGVAWSPDGRLLASGGDDGSVRLWEFEGEGELEAGARCTDVLEGHTRAVESVSWHPGGRRLASGSADRTVRVWDFEVRK